MVIRLTWQEDLNLLKYFGGRGGCRISCSFGNKYQLLDTRVGPKNPSASC